MVNNMKLSRLGILAVVVGFAACSTVEVSDVLEIDEEYSVEIRTTKNEYRPENNRLNIGVVFENAGTKPVYLGPGGNKLPFYILQKKEGAEWVVAYETPVLAILAPPQKVEPGEIIERDVTFINTDEMSSYPLWKINELTGEYRLVATVFQEISGDEDDFQGEPFPLEDRLTNTFTVESN